jgi:hypothetical protein
LLFNFGLEYAIKRVQANLQGLKLNVRHQLRFCADDVSISDGSIHIRKKNTETSVITSNETSPEVNAEKTKYMVMSRASMQEKNHVI